MRARRSLLLLLAAGCVPALPPPAHWGSMPATSIREQGTVSVTGSCCFVANLDAALPLGEVAAIDLGGQVGQNAVGGGMGLWLRSAPDPDRPPGTARGGARLGVNVGTGDILGALRYAMPYVGGSIHGQVAVPYESGHVLSFTGGIGMQRPLDLDVDAFTTTGLGERVPVVPTSDFWLDLDLNGEIEVADPLAVVVGGSIHLLVLPIVFPIPNLTVGLKF